MIATPIFLVGGILIAPLVLWVIFVLIRNRRKTLEIRRNGPPPEPPFEPTPEPTPNFLLRQFVPAERAYIRHAMLGPKLLFKPAIWIPFVILSAGLLPNYIDGFQNLAARPTLVWSNYLDGFVIAAGFAAYGGALLGMVTMTNFIGTAPGRLTRTRPFTMQFLFRAHTLPLLATLWSGIAIAVAASFLLVVAFYGPVWRHLSPDIAIAALQSCDCEDFFHSFPLSAVTSLPYFILSLFTTSMLTFSIATCILMQPLRFLRSPVLALPVVILSMFASAFNAFLVPAPAARILFLYSKLGPPPPLVFALIPITLSLIFLVLAEHFTARLET